MRCPVPGHIGLSMHTSASAPIESPLALRQVHLGDLLVERAAVELDAERVRLDGARLRIAQPLGARVLVAIVAVEAVVDLVEHLREVDAPIGQPEAVALAAMLHGADDHLLHHLRRALELDQIERVRRRVRELVRQPLLAELALAADHPLLERAEIVLERDQLGIVGGALLQLRFFVEQADDGQRHLALVVGVLAEEAEPLEHLVAADARAFVGLCA